MPAYIVSELDAHVPVLSPGVAGYSTGSYNDRVPPTRMQVTSVAISGDVATLGVVIREGYIPVVGALISVRGTQTPTSGGAPNFNVSNVALTAVSIDSITGSGTVSFALTSSNISTTADSGIAMVPQPEVGEALTSTTTGLQFGLQSILLPNNGRDVSWSTETPSAPSSYTAHLQGAEFDQESQYVDLDTMTAPGTQIVNGVRANFLRIKWTSVSGGTSPTGIGKILV
jgi:hypothetical protein